MKHKYYSRLVDENNDFLYYVNSSGYVYRVSKRNPKIIYYIKGYKKNNNIAVKIRSKEYLLKHLIASKFYDKYYPGICIGFKDNDFTNCCIDNLYFYSMKRHGKLTGGLTSKCKKVIVKQFGTCKEFSSVRSAAKYLYCSYQTLSDYLNGKFKKSVLSKHGRSIVYK